MATNAERQAAYRKRARENDRQLNVWLDHRAALALVRLARREGVSQATVIERLVMAVDNAVVGTLDPDGPEWAEYFGAPLGRTRQRPPHE